MFTAGWGRGFFFWGGDLKFFGKRQRWGVTKIFDRRRGGLLIFFSPLTKKGIFFFLDFFFIKEDHPNYSMLEESLVC